MRGSVFMKRMTCMLSGIFIMILVFAGTVLLIKNTSADEKETLERTEEVEIFLTGLRRAEMKAVEVVSHKGSYQIILQGQTAEIAGIEVDCLDTDIIDQVIFKIETLRGQEIVKVQQNLEQYGLAQPQASITVQADDRVWGMEIGCQIPGEENSRYVVVDHQDKIYRVNGLNEILIGQLDFVDRSVADIRAIEGCVPASVVLGGTVRLEDIVLGVSNKEDRNMVPAIQLKVLSKNNYDINYERTVRGLSDLLKIEADDVVSYDPSEKEYEEYGLQNPYSTVKYCWEDISGNSGEYRLLASAPKDGFVYLCRDGYPVIYKVSVALLSWLEWQYEDVITRYLLLPDIYTLETVRISCPEWSDAYTLGTTENEVQKVADSKNRAIPVEKFKEFYQCLIGIPAEEYEEVFVSEEAQSLLEITFVYKDGRDADKIELLAGPPLQVYLSINGNTDFLTKSKYVDIILENYRNLLTDKDIEPLY